MNDTKPSIHVLGAGIVCKNLPPGRTVDQFVQWRIQKHYQIGRDAEQKAFEEKVKTMPLKDYAELIQSVADQIQADFDEWIASP